MPSRTLIIMRHAKAEQSEAYDDFDRPLTKRGRTDAHKGGAWLAANGYVPDYVLCSSAVRTRQTWHEVAVALATSAGGSGSTVAYENDLYYQGLNGALRLIRELDPAVSTVLVVGHNPTMSVLSLRLDESGDRNEQGLKTSGVAVHEVTTDWADCTSAKLVASHTPRG
jgi:phosphohistidine phosphatase